MCQRGLKAKLMSPLTEQVEELDAPGAGEGVPDAGELRVEGIFEVAVGHRGHGGQVARPGRS